MEEGAEGGQARQAGAIGDLTDDDVLPTDTIPDPADGDDGPAGTIPTPDDDEEEVGADAAGAGGSPTSSPSRIERLVARVPALPYLVVTVTALFMTRAFWVPGRYVVGFDTYAYTGPNVEVTERGLRDLRIPQVNDLIFGGVPHLGNPPAGVWYPAYALTLLFETNRAMGVIVALHVVLLGAGMVLLARRLGAGRIGATVAGIAAVSSGAVLAKTIQFEQILVLAWLPMLLAAIHATLAAKKPARPMAAVAATTAAVLVAGHPQMVYETIVVAIAATIGFAYRDERWRRLPHLAAGTVLGVFIAAPALVAALASTNDGIVDIGRSFDELRSPALSLENGLLLRAVIGTPQAIEPAMFGGGFENVGSMGVVMAVLAVVGLARAVSVRASRPWAISLGLIAIVALTWTMGPRTSLFRIVHGALPGFDLARASGRWMVMFVLIAALFAGLGVDAVVARARRADAPVAAGAVLAVALCVLFGLVDEFAGRTALIWVVTAALVIGVLAVAGWAAPPWTRDVAGLTLLALLVVELGLMSRNSFPQQLRTDTPFTAYRAPTSDWLIGRDGYVLALTDDLRGPDYQVPGLRPNANGLSEIASIDGYDGGVQITKRWADALYRLNPEPIPELPLRNSLQLPIEPDTMARLGVRHIMLDRKRPREFFIPSWVGPVVGDDNFTVWENPAWIGEAVAWPAAELVASDREAADLLRTRPDDYATTALVDEPDAVLGCDEGCNPVGLDVIRHDPEHLEVRTSLDAPSVVMVTNQALPGWTVEVDGSPATELTVDGLFLGVAVPAGDHVVEWRYTSPLLFPTIVLSFLAALTALTLASSATIRHWVERRRREISPTNEDPVQVDGAEHR